MRAQDIVELILAAAARRLHEGATHPAVRRCATPAIGALTLAACAAWADDTTGRVAPEGPYRSRMRVIEPGVEPELAVPRTDAFGRALSARSRGYLAASNGETAAAINFLEQALATGALAPLAESELTRDLLVLLANEGNDEALVSRYLAATARGTTLDAPLHAAAATALTRLDRHNDALNAVDRALARDNPPPAWQRLKVVVLARLSRYGEAAALAARHLDTSTPVAGPWRELIDLYRAAGDEPRAVAVAELGVLGGALTTPSDRRYVARLYLASDLPDHAATLLAATVTLPGSADDTARLDLLLAAQRRAGDREAALLTARSLVTQAPSSARWQALGELAMAQGNADEAADAFDRALRDAPAQNRGRLLMALGRAHVARSDRRAARRAFTAASELGGVYRDAARALAELAAETSAPTSTGDDGVAPEDRSVNASAASSPPTETPPERALDRATVPRTRFYFAAERSDARNLPETVARLASRVGRSLRRERLVASGPLRIRVADASALAAGGSVQVQVGVPVRSAVPPRGGLRNVSLPPMDAVVRRLRADAPELGAALATAWSQLVDDVLAAGLVPGDDARTVILATDEDGRPAQFELQLAVSPAASGATRR